jgi:hypothetical protein
MIARVLLAIAAVYLMRCEAKAYSLPWPGFRGQEVFTENENGVLVQTSVKDDNAVLTIGSIYHRPIETTPWWIASARQVTDPVTYGLQGSRVLRLAWVPSHRLPAAIVQAAERIWSELINSGELSHCTRTDCIRYYWFVTSSGEHAPGACRVPVADGVAGAPVRCGLLEVNISGRKYIQTFLNEQTRMFNLGRPDFQVRVLVPGKFEIVQILNAASEALSNSPLTLATRKERSYVIGTADYRPSRTLEGWFETLTVRIDVDAGERSSEPHSVFVIASTTLYVSKQNTERNIDWTAPSAPQQQLIEADVLKTLKQELWKTCPAEGKKWLDSITLQCMSQAPDVEESGVSTRFSYSSDRTSW